MSEENKILHTQDKTRFFNEENFEYLQEEIKKRDNILNELEEWLKEERGLILTEFGTSDKYIELALLEQEIRRLKEKYKYE